MGVPDSGDPRAADLLAFAPYVEAFEQADFSAGRFHPAEEIEPNTYTWPSWESSPIVSEWHQALYDRHIMDPQSPYLDAQFTVRMREFEASPSLLSDQDLSTIRTVLTYIARGDRFCEGLIADMFEKGVAQAATRRLVDLATTEEPS